MLIKLVIISQTRHPPNEHRKQQIVPLPSPEKLTFDNIPLQRNPQKFYYSSNATLERVYPQTYSRFARANERQYRR